VAELADALDSKSSGT